MPQIVPPPSTLPVSDKGPRNHARARQLRLALCLLFVLSFSLASLRVAQTQEQEIQETIVIFVSRECPGRDDLSGKSVVIDGNRVEAKEEKGGWAFIKLNPGAHSISGLQDRDNPDAQLVAVAVLVGQQLMKEYDAASGSVTINMEESWFVQNHARPVIRIISKGDCGLGSASSPSPSPSQKKVDIFMASLECQKPSFAAYTINIDDRTVVFEKDLAADFALSNGKYSIRATVRGYASAKLKSVSVLSANGDKSFAKRADEAGEIEGLVLEDDLWEGATDTDLPALFLYTVGDCVGDYDPPTQRVGEPPSFKVVNVTGKVTVSTSGATDDETQITPGYIVTGGPLVYVRPGGRVELVASDRRVFILSESTVVQFKATRNADGKWEFTADMKAGSIEVRHVGYVKGEDGYEWRIVTPTVTVTENGTVYSVTHREGANVSSIGVEQGEVTLTPRNSSLPSLTISEHHQAEVFADRVGQVLKFFRLKDPTGKGNGSPILVGSAANFWESPLFIIIVAVVIAVLLLLFLLIFIFILYRIFRRRRAPKVGPAASNRVVVPLRNQPLVAPPQPRSGASAQRRCPNSSCGKPIAAGQKFCPECGTRLS